MQGQPCSCFERGQGSASSSFVLAVAHAPLFFCRLLFQPQGSTLSALFQHRFVLTPWLFFSNRHGNSMATPWRFHGDLMVLS